MILSQQARFISGAKKPPIIENPKNRVWGEIEETMVRLHPGPGVPTRRPAPKMSRFSGSKWLTSGGTRSQKSLALVPNPPRWREVSSGSVATRSMFPRVRSTSRLYPVSAYLIRFPRGHRRERSRPATESAGEGPDATLAKDDPEDARAAAGAARAAAADVARAVGGCAIDEGAVAFAHRVALVGVAECHLALEDVKELHLARLDDELVAGHAPQLAEERGDGRGEQALAGTSH